MLCKVAKFQTWQTHYLNIPSIRWWIVPCFCSKINFPLKMTLECSGCPFLSEIPGSEWLLHKTGPSACPRSQTPVPLMMPPQGIHLSSFASEQLQLCAGQCILSHILQKSTATELTRENSPFTFKDITRKLEFYHWDNVVWKTNG